MSILDKLAARFNIKPIDGMTPLEKIALRNNMTAISFYEAMRSASPDKIDLAGRKYGVLGDWIWVSRVQPSDQAASATFPKGQRRICRCGDIRFACALRRLQT